MPLIDGPGVFHTPYEGLAGLATFSLKICPIRTPLNPPFVRGEVNSGSPPFNPPFVRGEANSGSPPYEGGVGGGSRATVHG